MKVRSRSLLLRNKSNWILAQLLLALGMMLLVSLQASAETVVGTFRYARQDGVRRPITHAKVEIWRYAPRAFGLWSWGHDGTAYTDANGQLSTDMQFVQSGVIYAVRVFATNYAAVVWQRDSVSFVPFYKEPSAANGAPVNLTVYSPTDTLNFSYDFIDNETALHFNLAQTVRYGYDYASSHRDPTQTDTLAAVNVQPQSIPTSYYNPVNDTIVIGTSNAFQDIGTLHEYGHFLEERISHFFAMPSVHDGCTATVGGINVNSAEHAWMEGFADYFAQVVARILPPGTVTGGNGTIPVPYLETPPACSASTPDKVEFYVAASLWDLFDASGDPGAVYEPWDYVGRQDDCVFQIFDKELGNLNRAPTIHDFYTAWLARGCGDRSGLSRILSRYGIIPILPDQDAEYLQMSAPSSMLAGQTYNVNVVMRNTGITTWGNSSNHKLGSQNPQDNMNFGVSRVPLPHSVAPGAQVSFSFTVTAPSTTGAYALQYQMVQDGVEWFGDTTPSIAVTVTRRPLRLQVTPISKIGAIDTIKIDAFDAVTNAPVAGTVTSSITPSAATGSNITFTRPSATECTEGPTGKPICRKVPQAVAFTVTASISGYDPVTISY